jgi:cell division protein FtsA
LNAGFQVSDITPSVIASSRAVLTPQQKELGVCLLDIGAGTTDMAVFEEGDLTHLAVFPLGSERISHDLAVGLKTDVEIAEQIKKEFGSCILTGADKKERIDLPQGNGNGGPIVFSHKMLVKIIGARVSEIFDLVKLEIKKVSIKDSLPAGVVLTGGGAKLPKIVEIARKELNLPSRIGLPKGIDGLDEDPAWSAAAGLVLAGSELEYNPGPIILGGGTVSKLKQIIKVFIP